MGLSLDELRRRDLVPFRAAIGAGVPGVIVGHGLYAADDFVTPASLSRRRDHVLLKRELGFEGIAITDDLAAPRSRADWTVPDAGGAARSAGARHGVDLGSTRADQEAAYVALVHAVRAGRDLQPARLDAGGGADADARSGDYGLDPAADGSSALPATHAL